MLGLALIFGAVLLYKAYKLKLKHDSELKQLREDNANLRAQLETLRQEYEQLMQQRHSGSGISSKESLTDVDKLAQLAEAIRRKEPLL